MSDKQLEERRKELTGKIERGNKRVHFFQYLFNILIVGLLLSIIAYLVISQQQRTANVDRINANNTAQINTINRHLDCLAAYFSQENRANLTISNIDQCTLQSTTGVQQFFVTPKGTTATQ